MTSVVSAPGDILLHDGPFGVMYEADSKVSQAMDCSTRFKVHLYFTMLLKLTESVQKEKEKKNKTKILIFLTRLVPLTPPLILF